ncbi:MAG: hypothetical protein WCG34_03680 [Leptolinea sp.]
MIGNLELSSRVNDRQRLPRLLIEGVEAAEVTSPLLSNRTSVQMSTGSEILTGELSG